MDLTIKHAMGSKGDKMGMYDQHISIIGGENGDMGINWDIKGISPTLSNSGYFGVYPTCHFHKGCLEGDSAVDDHQPTRVRHAARLLKCSKNYEAINRLMSTT